MINYKGCGWGTGIYLGILGRIKLICLEWFRMKNKSWIRTGNGTG